MLDETKPLTHDEVKMMRKAAVHAPNLCLGRGPVLSHVTIARILATYDQLCDRIAELDEQLRDYGQQENYSYDETSQ